MPSQTRTIIFNNGFFTQKKALQKEIDNLKNERKALRIALDEYQNRTGSTKDLDLFCKKYLNLLIIVDREISVLQMYVNELTFVANTYKEAQVKSLQQAYLLK